MSRRLRKLSLTPWIWMEAWDWYMRGWARLMRVAAMMPKNAIHSKVALRRYSVRTQSMTLVSRPLADCGRELSRSGDGSPGGMWKGTVQPRQFRINSRVTLITSSIATAFSGATTTRALTSQKIGVSKYIGVKRPTSIGLTRPHTAKDMSNGVYGVFFGVTTPLPVRVGKYLTRGRILYIQARDNNGGGLLCAGYSERVNFGPVRP